MSRSLRGYIFESKAFVMNDEDFSEKNEQVRTKLGEYYEEREY